MERVEYGRAHTSLFGFGDSVVRPLGSVSLQLSMGTYPKRVAEMTLFEVVDRVFNYNVIFGRPGLNRFKAISSTLHNRVKFPTPHGV